MRFYVFLHKFARNIYLNLTVSFILLISSLKETVEEWIRIGGFHFSTHHGVVIFALLKLLKDTSEFLDMYEELQEDGES